MDLGCVGYWASRRAAGREGSGGRPAKPSKADAKWHFMQLEGDGVWIPPGHWHAVHTHAGEHIEHNVPGIYHEYAVHWVTWVWPQHMRLHAMLQWAGGFVVEKQSKKDVNGRIDQRSRQRVIDPLLMELSGQV